MLVAGRGVQACIYFIQFTVMHVKKTALFVSSDTVLWIHFTSMFSKAKSSDAAFCAKALAVSCSFFFRKFWIYLHLKSASPEMQPLHGSSNFAHFTSIWATPEVRINDTEAKEARHQSPSTCSRSLVSVVGTSLQIQTDRLCTRSWARTNPEGFQHHLDDAQVHVDLFQLSRARRVGASHFGRRRRRVRGRESHRDREVDETKAEWVKKKETVKRYVSFERASLHAKIIRGNLRPCRVVLRFLWFWEKHFFGERCVNIYAPAWLVLENPGIRGGIFSFVSSTSKIPGTKPRSMTHSCPGFHESLCRKHLGEQVK